MFCRLGGVSSLPRGPHDGRGWEGGWAGSAVGSDERVCCTMCVFQINKIGPLTTEWL
jgi:hypothetical protein